MDSISIPFSTLWNIAQGFSCILIMLGGYIINKMMAEQKSMQTKIDDLEKEIAAHRLLSSEKYEERSTVQSGLSRVHERMDEMRKDIHARIDGMGATLGSQMQQMQQNIMDILKDRKD